MLSDLAYLVSIPTLSDDRDANRKALDWVIERAASFGLRARTVCDGQVGEIEIPADPQAQDAGDKAPETAAILVHLDVVTPGIIENWETDPFTLTRKDGKLIGRGVQDDKGPLIASLYAMKKLASDDLPLRRTIRMIIGTKEETDWEDIYQYTAEYPLPDYGFTPDGEFPICISEKGILELDGFVPYRPGQTDGWHLTDINSGNMNNTVPGKATAEMTLFENGQPKQTRSFTASGKSIHSGEPELGDNAIYHLIDEIEKIGPAESSAWETLQLLRSKFADPYGRVLGIHNESEYYEGEYVGQNTICVTRLEIKDDELWFHVDIRYIMGADPKALQERLQHAVAPLGGRITEFMDLPPAFVKSDMPFIRILQEEYQKQTGVEAVCKSSSGGTYAQAMPGIVTFGPSFPDERDTCHEENEFVTEASFMRCCAIYTEAIKRLATSEF